MNILIDLRRLFKAYCTVLFHMRRLFKAYCTQSSFTFARLTVHSLLSHFQGLLYTVFFHMRRLFKAYCTVFFHIFKAYCTQSSFTYGDCSRLTVQSSFTCGDCSKLTVHSLLSHLQGLLYTVFFHIFKAYCTQSSFTC